MKRMCFVLLALLLHALPSGAQPVQMQVIIRNPAPGALPVWAADPSIVQIILRNTTAAAYDGAVISFEIRRLPGKAIVARSKDFHPQQPRFSLPPNGTLVLNGPQIIHESAIKIEDETLRQQAQAVGQLPEGDYEFCARLLDATGREIGTTGAFCPRTTVMLPDPPMLLHPRNDSTLAPGATPMFVWAPVTGSLVPITYTLRVAPLLPGQAPLDALRYNAAVLNVSGLVAPLYQYVPTDIPFAAFPQAVGFVWQVEALGPDGRPATRNNGRSEIFRFRFADTHSSLLPRDSSQRSTPGTSGDTAIGTLGAPSLPPSDTGSLIRRIELPGGFRIVLRTAIACSTATCTISGSGALYIPLLDDSVSVTFAGITVRRPTASGDAQLISGTFTAPIDASRKFGLLTLYIRQLEISSTRVLLDGAWHTRWSDWGWACGTADSIRFGAPLTVTGIIRQQLALPIPWRCTGVGLLIGPCIELRLDTLDASVAVDTSRRPPALSPTLFASGTIELPCLIAGGQPVRGWIRFRLDRGKSDLLSLLNSRLRDVRPLGAPLSFDADTLAVDLSSEANPAAFPPAEVCQNPAWSDPRWRGIYIPSLRAHIAIGDDTLHSHLAAIFDQGSGRRHAVTFVARLSSTDTIKVGGFGIRLDSATVRMCQGVLQGVSARGTVLMPPSLQRPSSWGALDSIGVRLSAYDDGNRWRWNATLDLRGGLSLRFGSLAELILRDGTIEVLDPPQGGRRGYIEFSHLQLEAPADNPTGTADFYGLRIWNTGEIELESAEGWLDVSRWAQLSVANLTIQAQEIGLGYSPRTGSGAHWWVGFSGGFDLDAGSALPTGGSNGFRVRRLRIWDDETITSEGAYVSASIAGAFRLAGVLQWGSDSIGSIPVRGMLGQLTGQFDCLGNLQAQVDFALGSTAGASPFHYWFLRGGAAVPGGTPIVPGAFHLVGGLFGAGWHVRLDSYGSALFTDASGLAPPPPIRPDDNVGLLLQGGLVFADPALQLYRLTATTSLAFGTSTQVALDGSIAILPQIRLATGSFWAQFLHNNSPRTISLGGSVDVNFINTRVFRTSASATFGSSSCLTLGPYSGEWIVADMDETYGSDLLGVKVAVKGFLSIGNLYARLCPSQGELFGSPRGAGVVGMHVSVGGIQLPHHVGLGFGTEFCGRYFYRFWYDGSNYRLTARAGGTLDLTANFDYSGYPWGHYTQAYDHVRGWSYASGDFVRLDRHWSACRGDHCKSSSIQLKLRGLFEADASIGTVPLRVGSREVQLPLLSSTRANFDFGYYGWAKCGDKAGSKRGGSLGDEAQNLSCADLDSWGSTAGNDNKNQIPPPPLVLSSIPARGDTGVPVTACILIRTAARLWAFAGGDASTRQWKCSSISATLEQLDSGGNPVRTVPLSQEPATPPLAGSDSIRYCVATAAPSYPWHVLLPGTRYRLLLEGTLESNDRVTVPAHDTIEFRTASQLDRLWLQAGTSWTAPLGAILQSALDTLTVAYPNAPAKVAPLKLGRDLWLEIEAGERRWRWTGSPNALIRTSQDAYLLGMYLGTTFTLDTALLQPHLSIVDLGGSSARVLPQPVPITIRVLNAQVEGPAVSRPSEAAAFLGALPTVVAEFHTSYLPSSVSTELATAIRWRGPTLPANAGIAGETTEPSAPVTIQLSIENRGTSGIYTGTPFELSIGAYVELPDRSRQYISEHRLLNIRSFVAPGANYPVEHTFLLPTGTRVLGVRARILPRSPFRETDGTSNNVTSQGELPPLGEDER
ncbi:MAG: hypothetical protein KatS3mg038_2669 [Candidatus Kapaibacterium sp.]|nr:MAG: hypothetical protein KatS3mg038_2669 [Candidatus Kapabacteria bacterium]